MKKIICALLLLLAVNSWGACQSGSWNLTGRQIATPSCYSCGENCSCNVQMSGHALCGKSVSIPNYAGCTVNNISLSSGAMSYYNLCGNYTCGSGLCTSSLDGWSAVATVNCTTYCTTQCEADSVANYASCIAQGNRWENCRCVENTTADSLLYACNDSPTPDGTSWQYKLYAINIHFENGTATTACGVAASLAEGEGYKQYCPVVRSGSGTCQSNGLDGIPNKECSDPSCKDNPLPKADCYAVVGSKCYMKDIYSGNTFSCECDGSCQQAIVNLVSGNCRNPYPPPSSSGSGGDPSSSGSGGDPSSSGSGGDSSGSGSDSSGSGSDSSGSGGKDYTDQLNQIIANTQGTMNNTADISQWTQETMNNTIDINNKLTEMGVDVSHIRNNTAGTMNNTYNTANNTAQMKERLNTINSDMNTGFTNVGNKQDITNERLGNINGKLNTTNDLLTSLNAKEWSPQVDVSVEVGGDTNIINVQGDTNIINVQVDSSKAPAEIKGILETFTGAFDDFVSKFTGIFGGDTSGWNGDTTGWGAGTDSARKQLDSALFKSDWVTSFGCDTTGGKKCDGAIIGSNGLDSAKSHLRGAYRALGDSLRNGVYGDSLAVWGSKFTGNGVITGSGGNNCPSVLSRDWHVTIGLTGFDITLGRYLCSPIFGDVTAWALCRLLLRASVALACMWFLFKCAVGFKGVDDD